MSFLQGNRGGRGGGARAERATNWHEISRTNEKLERYYNEPEFIPEEEREEFWNTIKKDLPNSFRFTGSRG
jgi:multisite-specific tRNA:(cytosine-C5)-methyltransferase